MGDVAGDVQPPAVHAVGGVAIAVGVEPSLRDGEDVLPRAGGQPGHRVVLEHRQRAAGLVPGVVLDAAGLADGLGTPEVLLEAPIGDLEPAGVLAVATLLQHVLEEGVRGAGVVEDAVDHDLEAAVVRLVEEIQEDLVGGRELPRRRVVGLALDLLETLLGEHAEVVVDVAEVRRVVLVHRVGLEDRVEVQGVDAELLQVGQRLPQPLEVAAVAAGPHVALALVEVFLAGRLAGVRVGLPPVAGPGQQVLVGVRARVIPRVAVAEALDEDLVPDGLLGPVRRLEAGVEAGGEGLGRVERGGHAAGAQEGPGLAVDGFEDVREGVGGALAPGERHQPAEGREPQARLLRVQLLRRPRPRTFSRVGDHPLRVAGLEVDAQQDGLVGGDAAVEEVAGPVRHRLGVEVVRLGLGQGPGRRSR